MGNQLKSRTVVEARDKQTAIALAAIRQVEYINGVDRDETGKGLTLVRIEVDQDGEPLNEVVEVIHGKTAVIRCILWGRWLY